MKIDVVKMGSICRERRQNRGLTQNDVAQRIKCDVRAVSQFETGKTTSWRILSWYMVNDILTNNIIKSCKVGD